MEHLAGVRELVIICDQKHCKNIKKEENKTTTTKIVCSPIKIIVSLGLCEVKSN